MTDIDNNKKIYLIIHNKDLIEILTINTECYSKADKIDYIKTLCRIIASKQQLILDQFINVNIENYLLYDSKEFKDFLKENEGSYVIIDYNNKIRCGYILTGGEISRDLIIDIY